MISLPGWFRMFAVGGALAAIACAGRTQNAPVKEAAAAPPSTPPPASPHANDPPKASDWLAIDSASKTATLTLEVASLTGPTSALINGYRNGSARIVVPVGWTVKWNWRNADTTAHSLVVMVQREKLPLEGGRAAFTNAMTRMVTEGLPSGGTDQTSFVAEEAGWYWLMCGVPGHALAGEWLELRVDPEARSGSVEVKRK
jgi:uncharacterized cupredoxin-like copper-binding protein